MIRKGKRGRVILRRERFKVNETSNSKDEYTYTDVCAYSTIYYAILLACNFERLFLNPTCITYIHTMVCGGGVVVWAGEKEEKKHDVYLSL